MTIYIELFLIQNTLINFCLLKLVYLTSKNKTSFCKLLFSSIIGAFASAISIYFLTNSALINLIKLATSSIMLIIAFKQSKKQFAYNMILLFLYTYAFGGIITSLSNNIHYTSFGTVMTSKFSLELICTLFIVFTYIFEIVVKHLKLKVKTNNLIYNLTITHGNKTIKINAYLDTGNFLHHNGKPVLILDLNTYLKLTNTNLINFYTSKSDKIQTFTVNGNNSLKLYKIDKIKIQDDKKNIIEFKDQLVAINSTNCFKNTNYQALLSPLFL